MVKKRDFLKIINRPIFIFNFDTKAYSNIVQNLIQFVQKTKKPKHCNDSKFFKLKANWVFFDKN